MSKALIQYQACEKSTTDYWWAIKEWYECETENENNQQRNNLLRFYKSNRWNTFIAEPEYQWEKFNTVGTNYRKNYTWSCFQSSF